MNARANVSENFMSFGVIAQHHAKISNAPMGDVFNFGVANKVSRSGILTKTAELARDITTTGHAQPIEVRQYGKLAPVSYSGGIMAETLSSGFVARSFDVSEPNEEAGYKH